MTSYWNQAIEHDKKMREVFKDKPAFPPACVEDEEKYIERMVKVDEQAKWRKS